MDKLLGPNGQPLITESKLIVVKVPKGTHIPPQLAQNIAALTRCALVEIPMEMEIMMGDIAAQQLLSLHSAIHAILSIPKSDFSQSEIGILFKALKFLCEKTQPGDKSSEVLLVKRLKQLVEPKEASLAKQPTP